MKCQAIRGRPEDVAQVALCSNILTKHINNQQSFIWKDIWDKIMRYDMFYDNSWFSITRWMVAPFHPFYFLWIQATEWQPYLLHHERISYKYNSPSGYIAFQKIRGLFRRKKRAVVSSLELGRTVRRAGVLLQLDIDGMRVLFEQRVVSSTGGRGGFIPQVHPPSRHRGGMTVAGCLQGRRWGERRGRTITIVTTMDTIADVSIPLEIVTPPGEIVGVQGGVQRVQPGLSSRSLDLQGVSLWPQQEQQQPQQEHYSYSTPTASIPTFAYAYEERASFCMVRCGVFCWLSAAVCAVYHQILKKTKTASLLSENLFLWPCSFFTYFIQYIIYHIHIQYMYNYGTCVHVYMYYCMYALYMLRNLWNILSWGEKPSKFRWEWKQKA